MRIDIELLKAAAAVSLTLAAAAAGAYIVHITIIVLSKL